MLKNHTSILQKKADKLPNDLQSNKIFLPILVYVPCFISNSNSVYFIFCKDRQAFIQLESHSSILYRCGRKVIKDARFLLEKNGNFTSSQIRQ